jgi:hypothetical protein
MPFSKKIIDSGLASLKTSFIRLVGFESTAQLEPTLSSTPLTSKSTDLNANYFFNLCNMNRSDAEIENEAENFIFNNELDKEINIFAKILSDDNQIMNIHSSRLFWKKTQSLNKLKELAIILSNICSSSAFIERFFSIAGIICESRRMNMKDDLVINRSLLKANMTLLKELNETCS